MGEALVRPLGRPGDLGWVVMAHGEVYDAEFGWDGSFEALVARIVADYANNHDPAHEAAWIAELDGARVGCVFCVAADDTTAQLRILLVHPSARGHQLGGRLVDECVAFARGAGYRRMKLWTNDPLVGRPRGSTCREVLSWRPRSHTTASASTSSDRSTSSSWDRRPCKTRIFCRPPGACSAINLGPAAPINLHGGDRCGRREGTSLTPVQENRPSAHRCRGSETTSVTPASLAVMTDVAVVAVVADVGDAHDGH